MDTNVMIGTGIFLGVGNTIYFAGPGGVLLTFALNGLIAVFTAMSYAELSSAIPRAGGASETGKVGAFFTLGQTLFLILIGIIEIVKAIIDPSLLQNFVPFLPHGWNKLLIYK